MVTKKRFSINAFRVFWLPIVGHVSKSQVSRYNQTLTTDISILFISYSSLVCSRQERDNICVNHRSTHFIDRKTLELYTPFSQITNNRTKVFNHFILKYFMYFFYYLDFSVFGLFVKFDILRTCGPESPILFVQFIYNIYVTSIGFEMYRDVIYIMAKTRTTSNWTD